MWLAGPATGRHRVDRLTNGKVPWAKNGIARPKPGD
jgi:hypothetical protein